MSVAGSLRRWLGSARSPELEDGGLPWSAIYPAGPPPAIARPAIAPQRIRAVAAVTGAPVTVAIANPDRVSLAIYNASPATMYAKFGPGASSAPGGYSLAIAPAGTAILETPDVYRGEISAIWASPGGGAASVTEL